MSILPTIGIINTKKLRGQVSRTDADKLIYTSLNSNFLVVLVGIIDGDGYISINKTTKGYIEINLTISLDIKDMDMLNFIKNTLKIGRINTYLKSGRPNTVKYIINRTDLQEIFFPLLFHHNLFFLTSTRRLQFAAEGRAMYVILNGIQKFEEIPNIVPSYFSLPINSSDYLELTFFKN
jgi:hypothetical protein